MIIIIVYNQIIRCGFLSGSAVAAAATTCNVHGVTRFAAVMMVMSNTYTNFYTFYFPARFKFNAKRIPI